MQPIDARLIGVELYFDDLERAKKFYLEKLGLEMSDEETGHHVKFESGPSFLCLERKGTFHILAKSWRFSFSILTAGFICTAPVFSVVTIIPSCSTRSLATSARSRVSRAV